MSYARHYSSKHRCRTGKSDTHLDFQVDEEKSGTNISGGKLSSSACDDSKVISIMVSFK